MSKEESEFGNASKRDSWWLFGAKLWKKMDNAISDAKKEINEDKDMCTPQNVKAQENQVLNNAEGFVADADAKKEINEVKRMCTPQNVKAQENQVLNNAGGFVFEVSPMTRFRRFLVLGVETGTYYAGKKDLAKQNLKNVMRLLEAGHGDEMLDVLVDFSVQGRTPKQDTILYTFAVCARQSTDMALKKKTYSKLPEVCRIPTHLFQFINYCEQISKEAGGSGWGRAHRNAICNWYLRFQDQPKRLAMHVTKYQSREGWSHRDVLRMAHPTPKQLKTDGVPAVLMYVVKGLKEAEEAFLRKDCTEVIRELFVFLQAVEEMKKMTTEDVGKAVEMIEKVGLVREHLPTQLLKSVAIWEALLVKMPMTAMIRSLGKMTSMDLISKQGRASAIETVVNKLNDDASLKAAKIHPFNVLIALKVYQQGHGELGDLRWNPNEDINTALNEAFYKSFKHVEPTNKRFCIALDVSYSMTCKVHGSDLLNCREASAAMAMVTARTEPNHEIVAFMRQITPIDINADMSLEDVIHRVDRTPMGGTDCAAPMLWAEKNNKQFDVFIIYTDNETWFGGIHPFEALKRYRKSSGITDARLIVVGMSATQFSIADPDDPGMLDITGFDSGAPEIMRNFTLGLI